MGSTASQIQYVTGDAEEAVEHLDIAKITSKGGHDEIFKILDERYKELTKDELQRCLKEYLYAPAIKPQETYRKYITKLDVAYRGLTRHNVELPPEVRGWILMRKLGLESTAEALLLTDLTETSGSIKYEDVIKSLRDVFPNGQAGASSGKTKDKDIFVADGDDREQGSEVMEEFTEEPQEIMEIVANQPQEQSDYERRWYRDLRELQGSAEEDAREEDIQRLQNHHIKQ